MSGFRRNEVYRAVAKELDAAGITHSVDLKSSGHMAVIFTIGGKRQSIFMATSPSDHRAPHQARSFVRRMLRQNNERTGARIEEAARTG